MSTDKIKQLSQISDQLDMLITSKNGVSPKSFWTGISLTLISMFATLFLTFGNLQSDVDNHINNYQSHITEEQKAQIILNTQHTTSMSRNKLDRIYASKNDLENLKKDIEKIKENHDN